MNEGSRFESELSRFESEKSGFAAFARATLEKRCPAGTEPSDAEVCAKRASAFADALLRTPWKRKRLKAEERDAVRCAVLLFPFLPSGEAEKELSKKESDVPNLEKLLKACATTAGIAGDPSDVPFGAAEETAAECVLLASRRETTDGLPEVGSRALKEAEREGRRAGYLDAVAIVREMTDGREWDGSAYEKDGDYKVVIDGQDVPAPKALLQAFLTVGEARKGRLQKTERREEALSPEEFLQRHPGWNAVVYGTPGSFFIIDSEGEFPISNEQATAFGIRIG